MPATTLDPNTALILIDLQKGILDRPTVHPIDGILANAATLARAFRRLRLPVVLVHVAGAAPGRTEQGPGGGRFPADWLELAPELEAAPEDLRVTKHRWGAFTETGLEARLRDRGITQVVIAGVATSIGVESTARQAHELGFNVTLALDAMTDRDPDAHDNSVTRIFPRLGETGTTAQLLALLSQHSLPQGRRA
jgi:nicotinamidase-related amidase